MIYKPCYTPIYTIIFLFLWMGCISPDVNKHKSESDEIKLWEINLRNKTDEVVVKVDSALLHTSDSTIFYQLLLIKAKAKWLVSDLDSAKILLERVFDYCTRHKGQSDIDNMFASAYNLSGNYFSRISAMDTANRCFLHAYVFAVNANNKMVLPDMAINIADSYVHIGRFDMAAFWYWKSISLSDSADLPESQRYPSYSGLAQVYMELRDYVASDSLYDKASFSFKNMRPFEQHIYLNNRGNSYYFRGDYKTALTYFQKSLKLVDSEPNMKFEQNLTYVNLGEIYLLLNQTDSASYYLDKCHDFFVTINNVSALYYIETQLIALALKQNDINLASKRLSESVKPKFVEPNMLHIRNKLLEQYYREKEDFKKAYHYQKENKRIDDSIRNERIKMRSSEVALKYRLDSSLMKKELLIRQQENKMLRLHEWIYLLVFGILFFAAVLGGLFFYRRRKNDKKLWELQTDINRLRLDNVRHRISPHFIFNVLNHEVNRFKDEIDKNNLNILVRLIRRNLELADQMSITLADELDFVDCFLSLEKASLGDDFKFTLEVDEGTDLNSIYVPSMFLFILVENAVKHSLLNKEGKRRLWIRIQRLEDTIEIKLCDNGGGFKRQPTRSGTGTGLKIITQTIQLFNQYNKVPIKMSIHNIEVEDDENGCEVSYSIPKDYTFIIKN